MNVKDILTKTGTQEENEAARLEREQLDRVAGGDRGGGHKPPANPEENR